MFGDLLHAQLAGLRHDLAGHCAVVPVLRRVLIRSRSIRTGFGLVVTVTPLYQGVALLRGLDTGVVGPVLLVHAAYLSVLGTVGLIGASRRLGRLLLPEIRSCAFGRCSGRRRGSVSGGRRARRPAGTGPRIDRGRIALSAAVPRARLSSDCAQGGSSVRSARWPSPPRPLRSAMPPHSGRAPLMCTCRRGPAPGGRRSGLRRGSRASRLAGVLLAGDPWRGPGRGRVAVRRRRRHRPARRADTLLPTRRASVRARRDRDDEHRPRWERRPPVVIRARRRRPQPVPGRERLRQTRQVEAEELREEAGQPCPPLVPGCQRRRGLVADKELVQGRAG